MRTLRDLLAQTQFSDPRNPSPYKNEKPSAAGSGERCRGGAPKEEKGSLMGGKPIRSAIFVIAAIFAVAAALYVLIMAVDQAARSSVDASLVFSEQAALQVTNTLGQAITAVGTVLAVILAISALYSTKTQGSVTTIETFRRDFDDFIQAANELHQAFINILDASVKLGSASKSLSYAVAQNELDLLSDEDVASCFAEYNLARFNFRNKVSALHDIISQSDNEHVLRMVRRNIDIECRGDVQELQRLVGMNAAFSGFPDSITSCFADPQASSYAKFHSIKLLANASCLRAFTPPEEWNARDIDDRVADYEELDDVYHSLIEGLRQNGEIPANTLQQIALYLPAMSTEKTYKKSLLKVFSEEIGDTYVIPAHLHFWST
ncbi:hypothetical protein, partial [Cereibacter changlensis]|uniref:hypothetical protein n=1 Tax=Cereibacter changlensis TaxID=402884 RepID=UPI00145E2B78